jgi:phosphoglycerate dehydrogenase-like enzyme
VARVLITTRIFTSNPAEAALDVLRDAGHEPIIASVPGAYLDGEQLHAQLSGIAGTMASSEPYTDETFRKFPELQVVARMGVGFDAIDLAAAQDHEVPVMIAAGSNDTTVAESAVGLLLALARDFGRYFETTSAGGWVRPPTTELLGKTIGLIGLGRIGRSVVRRLQGFEVNVVAAEPYPDLDFVSEFGIELVDIDEVFRRSSFVSLHSPMNDKTREVVNDRTLGLMPPGSFLVNTARGGLVDEAAVRAALDSGQLAGAALDVRTSEPPPKGDDLAAHPKVLPTPHMAGVSVESVERMAVAAAKNVVGVLDGDWDREMVVNGVYPA